MTILTLLKAIQKVGCYSMVVDKIFYKARSQDTTKEHATILHNLDSNILVVISSISVRLGRYLVSSESTGDWLNR